MPGWVIAQGYLYALPMAIADLQAWLVGREVVPVIAVPVNFNVDEVGDTVSFTTY